MHGSRPTCIPGNTIQAVSCFAHHITSSREVIVQAVQGCSGNLPILDTFSCINNGFVDVKVANIGSKDVWIPPKTQIGLMMEHGATDGQVQVNEDGIFIGFVNKMEARVNATRTSPEDTTDGYTLQKQYGVVIKWNYFVTSHGKGPVDDIGGATKRFVWNNVRLRKHIVKDAATFVAAATQMPKVQVEGMTSADIKTRNDHLHLDDVFDKAAPIRDIAQMHSLR